MLRLGTVLIVVSMVVLGAAVATIDDDELLPPQTSGTTTTSTPLDPSTTTTITVAADPAVALVTETGVVVAVRDQTRRGYLVTTTCGSTAFVTQGTPITEVQVVLDPGHGGEVDTGAVAPTGLVERDINLDLALATQKILEERGISTLLTRTGNYTVPLGVRAHIADNANAQALVSIHHNAPVPGVSERPGTEVFVQTDSDDSQRLGGLLYEHTFEALIGVESVVWHAAPDAGVLRVHNARGEDTYGMIRLPETPSALIEVLYINSREEAEFLETARYLTLASTALADAIEAYLRTDNPGSGFVEEPRRFTAQVSVADAVCEDVPLG
jgi:N-acetylmuramoyl-L-alanine amidase